MTLNKLLVRNEEKARKMLGQDIDMVYASMSPCVHIVNVGSVESESLANVTEIHDSLDFSNDDGDYSFGIFSVKFSTEGRELVAGSSDDSIYVYDVEANRLSLRIQAHMFFLSCVSMTIIKNFEMKTHLNT